MPCFNTVYNSYQKWYIGNDVRSILLNDEDVVAQVGVHIYPLVAPEGTDGDFIIYSRQKYSKYNTKGGVYEDDCLLAVIAVSDNYDNSVALASKIDNALTGQHNIEGTRIDLFLQDSTEEFTENKFIQTLLFQVK